MKNYLKLMILALGISIIVSIVAAQSGNVMGNQSLPLLTINQMPIDEREFMLFLNMQRARVVGYFNDTYGISDHPNFWTTTYSGETPIAMAKQLALEELKSVKIQQLLAIENGLLDDSSYATFSNQLTQENARREKAVANKQVIYGPVQYEEWGYYNYLFSNLVIKLKQVLARKESAMTESEARTLYANLKDRLYKKEGGYRPLEEVKDELQARYEEERYQRKVEQLIQKSEISINYDSYNAIK
jgi:hypothetical protein